jgi:alpha-beta hydrolase superfamily lysophospholipase
LNYFQKILAGSFLCSCLFLSGCTHLIFFPSKTIISTPERLNLSYETVMLTASDGTLLHNWLIKPDASVNQAGEHPPKGTLLFLHGNAENISTHIFSVAWLVEQGYEVLLLDYRGYGQSAGEPGLPDVFLDIEAASQWLIARQQHNRKPVYMLGQSLGATLASYYVGAYNRDHQQRLPINGLILDAPFSDYHAIAQEKLAASWVTWLAQYFVPLLITNQYSPYQTAPFIPPTPVLLFHSQDDVIVPAHHSELLQQLLNGNIETGKTNGPHTATFQQADYRKKLLEFLSRHQ